MKLLELAKTGNDEMTLGDDVYDCEMYYTYQKDRVDGFDKGFDIIASKVDVKSISKGSTMEIKKTSEEKLFGDLYTTYQNERFSLEKCETDFNGVLTIYLNFNDDADWLKKELGKEQINFEFDDLENVFTIGNEMSPSDFESDFEKVKNILESR